MGILGKKEAPLITKTNGADGSISKGVALIYKAMIQKKRTFRGHFSPLLIQYLVSISLWSSHSHLKLGLCS